MAAWRCVRCIGFRFGLRLTVPATPPANGLSIVVIPKGTTHEFWKSIHAGAIKAKQELEASGQPVKIIWKGPLKEDGPRRADQGSRELHCPRRGRHGAGATR